MSGAAFSGYLSEPYGRVPLLGRLTLFEEYQYILPGLVMLGCSIISAVGIALFVPEVRPRCTEDQKRC